MNKLIAGLLLLAVWMVTSTGNLLAVPENTLKIIENGKSSYSIVIDKAAVKTVSYAAKELQDYLFRATGVKLPVVNSVSDGKNAIYVGNSSYAKNAGVDISRLKPEGYYIKTVGFDLFLVGRDTEGAPLDMHWARTCQTGSLSAVYDFLERYVGVRWVMSGPMGEVVPKSDKLIINEINIIDYPGFVSRNINFMGSKISKKETYQWLRRMRIGRTFITMFWHHWWRIFPLPPSPDNWPSYMERKQPYFDHPEYYALVDGKRVMRHRWTRHEGQICTSNPDVVRICAEEALKYFKEHPKVGMFSINANDGGGYCECENCRKLDIGYGEGGAECITDRMMHFYNEVGKLVYEKDPTKFLGCYAYNNYVKPPKREIPFKNLAIEDVHNSAAFTFYDESTRRKRYERLRQWSKLTDNLCFVSYYHGMGFWGMPLRTSKVLGRLMSFLKNLNTKHVYISYPSTWGASGADCYLTAKLMWDPSQDYEYILDDYYKSTYGKEAGEIVAKYHQLIEDSIKAYAEKNTKIMNDTNMLGTPDIPETVQLEEYYRPIVKQVRKLFESIDTSIMDEGQRARYKILVDNFKLVELTLDAKDAALAVKKNLSMETCVAFSNKVKAREAFLDSQKDTYAIDPNYVREQDVMHHLPVTKKLADYYLSTKGERRKLSCRRIDKPIVIDGKLDDEGWKSAEVGSKFVGQHSGLAVKNQTGVRLLYDKDNLYISFECSETDADKLRSQKRKRDDKTWTDNEVEIFFDIERSEKSFTQFIVNSSGSIYEGKAGKSSWNPNWSYKVGIEKDKWVVEIAVPFSSLGKQTPVKGDIWNANFCRVRKVTTGADNVYSCFSPTFGNFGNPNRFGYIIFE